MPRTTLGGDDPDHQLPADEKERRERELRAEARQHLLSGEPKECKRLNDRAKNISRRPSQRADHH
ncbi:MAG TPA: hypothetical protein VND64_10845 [Pirellulales bacterium]|nr:hypothetical protein [Pirellulales bacterium]